MTMPRRQLVDVAVTRYYNGISRCVRRAFLCGEGVTHRKAWIKDTKRTGIILDGRPRGVQKGQA